MNVNCLFTNINRIILREVVVELQLFDIYRANVSIKNKTAKVSGFII